jgi:WhiB family redox-sensing transcriptional regulator
MPCFTAAEIPAQDPQIELDPMLSRSPDLPCRVQDRDLWFAEIPAKLERAKSFCADCSAREACLAGALARREPWGVWGGEIFVDGKVVAVKRRRGRPPVHPRPPLIVPEVPDFPDVA